MRAPINPQVRFLLRGSSLLVLMLALWWMALLHPMLSALQYAADLTLRLAPFGSSSAGASTASNGDWILQVPIPQSMARLDSVQRTFGRTPGAPLVKVRSFKLAIAERIPIFFTLSFPLFWALMLAAPRAGIWWRAPAIGTAILSLLALLSLLYYTAFAIETNLHLFTSDLPNILWSAGEYLNLNVLPYLAPIILAMLLHVELRAQIFSWDAAAPAPVVATTSTEKSRRGRYRAR